MKRYCRHILAASSVLMAGVLSVLSCSKDDGIRSVPAAGGSAGAVTFDVSLPDEWAAATRSSSATRTETILMNSVGGEDTDMQIFMYMIEEDIPASTETRKVETRAEGEGDNSGDEPLKNIGIFGYQLASETYASNAEGAGLFMDNIDHSTYGDENYPENPFQYWPGPGTWFKFFAYTPYDDTPEGGYTVANAGEDNMQPKFTYEVPSDIDSQLDIMVGTHDGTIQGNITSENFRVVITLQHILSQIAVKTGTLDEGRITSVSFKDLYDNGAYLPSAGNWVRTGDADATYVQDLVTEGGEQQSGADLGREMYLMPQQLTDQAEIEINLEVKSKDPNGGAERTNEYTCSLPLNNFTKQWAPGKKYTYVITTPQEVEVSVDDVVDGAVKSNLVIKNTGLATAYIRVAIVGSWVIPNDTADLDDDVVVADWSESDGEFAGFNSTEWVRLDDGYYYHMAPVKKGESAAPLFESYKLKNSPVAGAELDLTIVAQAVLASDVSFAWPQFAAAAGF